jgi:hypothetical protein
LKSFAARHYRWFDEFNPLWNEQHRRQNPIFVAMVQEQLNESLRIRGYVTLNEALELLGFERDRWGDQEGWVRDPAPGEGDGYVYFGVWDKGFTHGKAWIHGKLDGMTISFNVDKTKDPLSYRVRKLREEGKI